MAARAGKDAAPGASRTQRVFEQLREDILSGRFAPGEKLGFAGLVERHGASIGVIREALTRLVEQGLVRSESQQGFWVVTISSDDLADLTEARAIVEGAAIRLSVEHGGLPWESAVVAAHHVLSRTPTYAQPRSGEFTAEWAQAHRRFHLELLGACPNHRILTMASGLRDSAELYRRWAAPIGHDHRRDLDGEHQALLDACLARDAVLAEQRLRAHLHRTATVLLDQPEV